MFPEIARAMQDDQMRKEFGARIKALRKQRKWTQKELATKLEVRLSQLNKYEAGVHVPPVEKLLLIAELYDTTIDYLVTGNHADDKPLHDTRLLERFRSLENFDLDDRETVVKLIDAMIAKKTMERTLEQFKGKTAR
jgi:transcriptional regulator with XRE-family HTH domain